MLNRIKKWFGIRPIQQEQIIENQQIEHEQEVIENEQIEPEPEVVENEQIKHEQEVVEPEPEVVEKEKIEYEPEVDELEHEQNVQEVADFKGLHKDNPIFVDNPHKCICKVNSYKDVNINDIVFFKTKDNDVYGKVSKVLDSSIQISYLKKEDLEHGKKLYFDQEYSDMINNLSPFLDNKCNYSRNISNVLFYPTIKEVEQIVKIEQVEHVEQVEQAQKKEKIKQDRIKKKMFKHEQIEKERVEKERLEKEIFEQKVQEKKIQEESNLNILSKKERRQKILQMTRIHQTDIMIELREKYKTTQNKQLKQQILDSIVLEFSKNCITEIVLLNLFAEMVFNYHKYTFDKQTESNNYILDDNGFEFNELINGFPLNIKRKFTLLAGDTQSGKTFMFIALIHINLALGKIPVLILKRISDKRQFFSRYKKESNKLVSFMRKEGYPEKKLQRFSDPIYIDSKMSSNSKKEAEYRMKQSLTHKRRRLIVCLGSGASDYHTTRVLERMKQNSNVVLFIDEAHILGGYKRDGKELAYDRSINELKEKSFKVFLITATPQRILLLEENLYTKGCVVLPRKTGYRGIDHDQIVYNIVDISTEIKINNTQITESLFNTLYELSGMSPKNRINKFGIMDKHPNIMLASNDRENTEQHSLLKLLKKSTKPLNRKHRKIIDTEWTVFTVNQNGIRLYSNKIITPTLTICDESADCINNEYLFKNIEVCDILDYLAFNGGANVFSHILIIAYDSANEGTTFSSTYTGDLETDANWHLTHRFMKPTKNLINAEQLEQDAGRLNGNHGDNIVRTVYCSEKTKRNLINAYALNKTILKTICELGRNGDVQVKNIIKDTPRFKNRFPLFYMNDNAMTKKNCKDNFTLCSNPNKKEDQLFNNSNTGKELLQCCAPDIYGTPNGFNDINEDDENIEEEFIRLKARFQIWSNASSKIANFMHNLDPDKIYSEEELKDFAKDHEIDNFRELTVCKRGLAGSRGYGKIMEIIAPNQYKLYECLNAEFKKYF